MKRTFPHFLLAIVGAFFVAGAATAQEPFTNLVGPVAVGPVKWKAGDALEVPYILWGGDVATFHANGGLNTKPGSTYQKLGLNLKLRLGLNLRLSLNLRLGLRLGLGLRQRQRLRLRVLRLRRLRRQLLVLLLRGR